MYTPIDKYDANFIIQTNDLENVFIVKKFAFKKIFFRIAGEKIIKIIMPDL